MARPERLKAWADMDLYRLSTPRRKDKRLSHDGPPYANGELHVGHAINKILNIIIKSKTLSGLMRPTSPVGDYRILPIELNVEEWANRGTR